MMLRTVIALSVCVCGTVCVCMALPNMQARDTYCHLWEYSGGHVVRNIAAKLDFSRGPW